MDTQTNKTNVSTIASHDIYFVFAAELDSSDSSDYDVPCLNGGTIQQEYGKNAVFFNSSIS